MSECKVAVLTEDQVRQIVGDAVRAALAEHELRSGLDQPAPPVPPVPQTRPEDADYYSTAGAAKYLETTVRALLNHVQRGNLKPDSWGGRGAFKSHRFSKATLDAFSPRKG